MASTTDNIETSIENISELLARLNIEDAYYVDDYNHINELPYISYQAKEWYNKNKELLTHVFGERININVPGEDELGEEIASLWDSIGQESKEEIITSVFENVNVDFSIEDYHYTKELGKQFPPNTLQVITPDEWEEIKENFVAKYSRGRKSKALLLFDQDLRNSINPRFSNGTVTGLNLITELKNNNLRNNVYCVLISHLIDHPKDELIRREELINNSGLQLKKQDFFALSKSRIKDQQLLYDGIKKSFLNGYSEKIISSTSKIIELAYKEVLKTIVNMDTYDFDDIVLKSSYGEGTWEINTLFRIANNQFNTEAKKIMIEKDYQSKTNPLIRKAREIGSINFKVKNNLQPYKDKLKLRHNELYEVSNTINKLHSPIENGDIFEITEGKKQGRYLLLGQDCDLMIRNNPAGARSLNHAHLFKIVQKTQDEHKKEIEIKYQEYGHTGILEYFDSRFVLNYFKINTDDIGVLYFKEPHIVNMNVVDLCVFNSTGKAIINISEEFNCKKVSSSWESRYNILVRNYKTISSKLNDIQQLEGGIHQDIIKKLKLETLPRLSQTSELAKQLSNSDDNQTFDFGLKRIMRLNRDDANRLLNSYHAFNSRYGINHDFAK